MLLSGRGVSDFLAANHPTHSRILSQRAYCRSQHNRYSPQIIRWAFGCGLQLQSGPRPETVTAANPKWIYSSN